MTVVFKEAPCTSGAYDYPKRGAGLRHTKHILAVVHQAVTGPIWAESAMRTRNTPGYVGNTATWYCDALPDGSAKAYHFIDGTKHTAWGSCPESLSYLDVSRPSIKTMYDHCKSGVINPNECVVEQLEWSGRGDEPWTEAQFEAAAIIIARASKATGIPISRDTVIPHRDMNTRNRPSDPWPAATREARMLKLVTMAKSEFAKLTGTTPVPVTPPAGDDMVPSLVVGVQRGTQFTVRALVMANTNVREAPDTNVGKVHHTSTAVEKPFYNGAFGEWRMVVYETPSTDGKGPFLTGYWVHSSRVSGYEPVPAPVDPTPRTDAEVKSAAHAAAEAVAKAAATAAATYPGA